MNKGSIPYPYPLTLNIGQWERYLGRRLTNEEYSLIESVRDERDYNRDMEKLHIIAGKRNLYIPKLTPRNGNCLFESLNILNLCDDQNDFRKFIAHLMYVFKDHKNFFQNDPRTLEQMFNDTNEVQFVLCNEELLLYKYTYSTMCQDFATGCSWTRLPTQLIMQFISMLMNVKFEIYSNMSEYINVLDATGENQTVQTIHLGHIGERHYVPLSIKSDDQAENICPKYEYAKRMFLQWAKSVEFSINSAYINSTNIKEKEVDRPQAFVEAKGESVINKVEYD